MAFPLYLTSPTNIRYLTGFTGTSASILLTEKMLFFFTDARYFDEAKKHVRLFGNLKNLGFEPKITFMEIKKGAAHPLVQVLKKYATTTMRFEEEHISFARYRALKKRLKHVKLVPCTGIIEGLRAVKTEQEIEYTKKAQNITEHIFQALKLRKGQSEIEVERDIRTLAKHFGAQGMAFDPIVAFGSASAIPHHKNSDRKLKKGDVILIDMGARLHGYHADMTRVLFTTQPTVFQKKIYETVRKAHEYAVSIVEVGKKGEEIEKEVRQFLKKTGFERYFTHSLSHGVGLEIHEYPTPKDPLKKNMLITIEPGIYLPGKFGIRLENIYRIKAKGVENLNETSLEIAANILRKI